jgi:DNA-binding XRE family transcriptional regulator
LLDRLEEAEDATALDRFERRIAAEDFDQATADYLPAEFVRQLLEDEHPIRVWRAHRGMTREALAAAAGVAPNYLGEIETGRKPGSFAEIAALAAALGVSLDVLAPWLNR